MRVLRLEQYRGIAAVIECFFAKLLAGEDVSILE